jgi:hypothetical protein
LFVISYLPMLVMVRRGLRSYSASNLVVANVGNVIHSAMCSACLPDRSGYRTRSTSSAAR